MNRETAKEETLMRAYQHISNGGVEYRLEVKRWKNSRDEDREELFMVVSMSNFGVRQETWVPLFKTSAPILEKIAHYIAIRDDKDSAYAYLSAITATIEYPDGDKYVFVPPSGDETMAKAVDPDVYWGARGEGQTSSADDTPEDEHGPN